MSNAWYQPIVCWSVGIKTINSTIVFEREYNHTKSGQMMILITSFWISNLFCRSFCPFNTIVLRAIAIFPVFRLLTDFVCLLIYEFWLCLWKIAQCSVISLLPLFLTITVFDYPLVSFKHIIVLVCLLFDGVSINVVSEIPFSIVSRFSNGFEYTIPMRL